MWSTGHGLIVSLIHRNTGVDTIIDQGLAAQKILAKIRQS